MKIGILELREDSFIRDVVSALSGAEVEFLSFRGEVLPFPHQYRVVLDRLSYCHVSLREMMKSLALSGAYVINNPFASTATNKLIDLIISDQIGIPHPRTFVMPGKTSQDECEQVIREPDWDAVARDIGFPCVVKPFDGFGWTDVWVTNSLEELQQAYRALEFHEVLLVQQLIRYKDYYRVFCINKKDVLPMKWNPKPLGAGEYTYSDEAENAPIRQRLAEQAIRLNAALDLDINAVEWCIDEEGRPWVIDAFNEVPEVAKEKMPAVYYNWIVEKFAACIQDKLDSEERNKTLLLPSTDPIKSLAPFYPPPH
jgi:hypothetical protein